MSEHRDICDYLEYLAMEITLGNKPQASPAKLMEAVEIIRNLAKDNS